MITGLFWSYVVVTTLFCLTPGPAVLFVVGQSLWRGAKPGFAAIAGIQLINCLWLAIATVSLTAILALSATAFQILKWAGAAYLAYLGVKAIRQSFREGEVVWRSSNRAFIDGVLVQASNPKSVLFVTAILPQFIDKSLPVPPQIGVLAVTGVAIDSVTMAIYVFAAGLLRDRLGQLPALRTWLDRVSGAILILVALATALYHPT